MYPCKRFGRMDINQKRSYAQQLLFVFIPKVEIPHAVILIPRFVEVVLLGRGFTSIDFSRTTSMYGALVSQRSPMTMTSTHGFTYIFFFIASLFGA